VTGAWGANTFPVRKQLSNPHFQNLQTFVFLVFLTFSSNMDKRFGPSILAFSHPRWRIGCDSWWLHWGLVRELDHSINVQCFFIVTSSLFMFPFPFCLLFCPYFYITFAMLLCLVCVCLSITFIVRNIFSMHMTPTPRTHIEMLGPILGSMWAIRSGGRSVVMPALQLAW